MSTKRDLDKKIKEDQEAAAHVFEEFVNTFQDCSAPNKTFVKSGVLYGDKNEKKPGSSELYTPKPRIQQSTNISIKNALECAKILKENNRIDKLKKQEKRKSNLELLKDELKLRHSERDERERLKEEILSMPPGLNYFEGGDPNSSNLFVASLNTKITENDLMKEFGEYGPLASVKIMWPRGDDRFCNQNTNCGFVAFMSRKDADRALRDFKHRTDMRVGWGKSVDIPAYPTYIPDKLLKLYLPPPQSGLPFNAQPINKNNIDNLQDMNIHDILYDSVVKVTIPLNKKILTVVNRVVEFVVKEGPMFEAVIMNKELGNPEYNFLFEYKDPVHVYYRWKLYSILHGDAVKSWNMKAFRMFKGGSIWIPPIAPNYSEGMPDSLIKNHRQQTKLSDNQCERLIDLIQNLTISRNQIAEAMVFCLNHLPAIKDIFDIIIESLMGYETRPINKISRLYLLSDVLCNSLVKNVKFDYLEGDSLIHVFENLQHSINKINTNIDKDNFRKRVNRVLKQWESYKIFSISFIQKLESYIALKEDDMDDGNSSSDEPLDGASLLKRSLKNPIDGCVITNTEKIQTQPKSIQYCVASKWDSIEPEEVQAQAMSSTKLYYLELESETNVQNERMGRKRVRVEENSDKNMNSIKYDHSLSSKFQDRHGKCKESSKKSRRKK